MATKNIAAVVAIFAAFAASVNAQAQVEGYDILTDGTSERVENTRKAISDAGLVEGRQEYTDEVTFVDGNATWATRAVSKRQATQGWSIGLFGRYKNFADKSVPGGGASLSYGRRGWEVVGSYAYGVGRPDVQSDDQSDFSEWSLCVDLLREVASWDNHHWRVMIGAGISHETRKDRHEFGDEENPYFFDLDAKVIGWHGGVALEYAPKWSNLLFRISGFYGMSQNYKGNIYEDETRVAGGGKKWYNRWGGEFTVAFNLSNKKAYNKAMLENGYTQAQIWERRNRR